MKRIIQPLRNNWKIDEDSAVSVYEQIEERVNAEDWFTHCRGYPIIRSEDITRNENKKRP